jgi:hypothetical protein
MAAMLNMIRLSSEKDLDNLARLLAPHITADKCLISFDQLADLWKADILECEVRHMKRMIGIRCQETGRPMVDRVMPFLTLGKFSRRLNSLLTQKGSASFTRGWRGGWRAKKN